jgi:hypothetical protein
MLAAVLDISIRAVCPIHGVVVGREDDRTTWRIDFKDEATAQQRAAGSAVLAAFDPSGAGKPAPRDFAAELDEVNAVIAVLVENGMVRRSDIESKKNANQTAQNARSR